MLGLAGTTEGKKVFPLQDASGEIEFLIKANFL